MKQSEMMRCVMEQELLGEKTVDINSMSYE